MQGRWRAVSAAGALLALGALLKWPCLHHPWDGTQYAFVCYSDIMALYHVRGIGAGVFPYVEGFLEYPVLTGLWMWAAGAIGGDPEGYFWANVALLGAAGLLVAFLLQRMAPAERLWIWVFAPSLALSAFLNFDLIAVAFATLALFSWRRGDPFFAAVALGLGAAAKVYPAFFVPVFAAALLRERGVRPAAGFVAYAAVSWFLVQLPFLLIAPGGWWETYSFHSGRTQEWETLWMIVSHGRGAWGWDWAAPLLEPAFMTWSSRLLFGVGALFAAFAVWRGWMDVAAGCLLTLVAFFLVNPVFNAQYVLWILPLLVLVPTPRPWVVLLLLADVGVHLTKFHLFLHFGDPLYDTHFQVFAVMVVLRLAAFAAFGYHVARGPVAAWRAERRGADTAADTASGTA